MNAPAATLPRTLPFGMEAGAEGASLRLWAPRAQRIDVAIQGGATHRLQRTADGWHAGDLPGAVPGDRYLLRLDGGGKEIPDPFSRCQPAGVHGPSEIVELDAFPWSDDAWRGVEREDLVIYELHLGTFTDVGTCDAAIEQLDDLADLGVTAIEVMPIAQCPGRRNWGYDGVYPFAVQWDVGGPIGLQRLVDACHARGIAVVLDVVYNHFGPEGFRLGELVPIATDRYRTPWGDAVNVDGPDSDGVRTILFENARQWFTRFHIDGLRLDAVHEIHDESADPFLAQLARRTAEWSRELGRPLHLIAESDLNAGRLVRRPEAGGYGLCAQWMDDYHHALHALLTGERHGYFGDYGSVDHLRKTLAKGFVFDGCWSESRRRSHGQPVDDLPTDRFVVCSQNHDQIGNRLLGERLASLTDPAGLRCAAAAVLLSPYLPMLFMGEEYGETRPFLYFVDHGDPDLIQAVREGRRREFAAQHGDGEMPDPAAAATRDRSCLDPLAALRPSGARLRAFYRACLSLRRSLPSLRPGSRDGMSVPDPHPGVVALERRRGDCRTLLLINPLPTAVEAMPLPAGTWRLLLDSTAPAWGGDGDLRRVERYLWLPARSAALFGGEP